MTNHFYQSTVTFGLTLGALFMLIIPQPTHAVMPPDFIFNIGAQVFQFFSIAIAFFSVVFGTTFQFFRRRFGPFKYKKSILIAVIFGLIILAFLLSYFYAQYLQNLEYQQWLADSRIYAE